MNCPNCRKDNPSDTIICECGYKLKDYRSPVTAEAESENKSGVKIQRVIIKDVQMEFWSMIVFMVKWVIASIPAFLILFLIGMLLMVFFGGVMSAF